MASPYENLPLCAFWRTGVAECQPTALDGIYVKKWELTPDLKIATAGSCFAQHISRYLNKNGFSVMDVEPPPPDFFAQDSGKFGYGLYSARYGNIYTVHQLLQLAREVAGIFNPADAIWERDGRFYDALRPSVEPIGLSTSEQVRKSREDHLCKVKDMFSKMDLFVFTLGLTEAWIHRQSGTVFPTAPETIAGVFDCNKYEFKNYNFEEIYLAFNEFQEIVRSLRVGKCGFKILLTVSPVPLTATASGKHILQATTYSKSVLRTVAGQLASNQSHIDYFPSYEIITNPSAKTAFYDSNLRTVRAEGVQAVMRAFFHQHDQKTVHSDSLIVTNSNSTQMIKNKSFALPNVDNDPQCEEALLDAFSNVASHKNNSTAKKLIIFIGDSHLAGVKSCVEKYFKDLQDGYDIRFLPVNWLVGQWSELGENEHLTVLELKDEYTDIIKNVPSKDEMRSGAVLCLVGLGMLGDGIVRAHGSLLAGSPDLPDGRRFSPNIPIITSDLSEFEIDYLNSVKSIKDYDYYVEFYSTYFADKKKIIYLLKESGIYSNILWISAPNMVEDVARFRFGDEYVESRSQYIYNRISTNCFRDFILDTNVKNGWLILHSQTYETLNGFTQNIFAANKARNDIHTNAEFYRDAMQQFFDMI